MKITFGLFRIKNQQGYTIVEMLVASALLIAVLLPTLLYLGKIVHNPKARDIMTATQLARERMEKTTAGLFYENLEESIKMNHKVFIVKQDIQTQNELIFIYISVYREKSNIPLITLKKYQMLR